MRTYRTSEVAAIIGVHPNTVRLYERLGLIPTAKRDDNGYRAFTEFHVLQMRLARTAFQVEIVQGGLRRKIVGVVRLSADGRFDEALALCEEYVADVRRERAGAEEAVAIAQGILSGEPDQGRLLLGRKEAAEHLGVSMDALRNWERNGLVAIRRKGNGYRAYTAEDIRTLKVIRALRCANYSLEAIYRMLGQLRRDPNADMLAALNTPREQEDIVSVCDSLITSLDAAERNALRIASMLERMKRDF